MQSCSGDESTDNETSEQKVNTNTVEDKENMESNLNKMKSTQDEQWKVKLLALLDRKLTLCQGEFQAALENETHATAMW